MNGKLLFLLLLTISCIPLPSKSKHFYTGRMATPIKSGETIAILKGASVDIITEAEGCLTEAIQQHQPDIKVVTSEEFSKSFFPYKVPEETETKEKYMQLIVNNHLLKERGVRFVFLLDSETTHDAGLGMLGLIPVLGAGRDSSIKIEVFEFGQDKAVGTISSDAKGSLGILGPITFSSLTETNVCDELIPAVSGFLKRKNK